LPTLQFGKAIEISQYTRIFSAMGFGATRCPVRSGVTEQEDRGLLLVLEDEDLFEYPANIPAPFHESLGC
jgi:hypothetical protein